MKYNSLIAFVFLFLMVGQSEAKVLRSYYWLNQWFETSLVSSLSAKTALQEWNTDDYPRILGVEDSDHRSQCLRYVFDNDREVRFSVRNDSHGRLTVRSDDWKQTFVSGQSSPVVAIPTPAVVMEDHYALQVCYEGRRGGVLRVEQD